LGNALKDCNRGSRGTLLPAFSSFHPNLSQRHQVYKHTAVSIDQTHVTTLVHGTFGYLDIEYFQSSQFTDKSDAYSFGVVLVELLTGQKAVSFSRSDGEARSLVAYFIQSMKDNHLFDILDPQVMMQGKKEDVLMVATLARSCLGLNGKGRPAI
jgi:hypothetical protein